MKKKLLALVLALTMVLSLLPVTAMAADTYTVTLDRDNYDGFYLKLVAYNNAGVEVDKIRNNDSKTTLSVPKDGYVVVEAIGNFTVAADGATVGDLQPSEELSSRKITNFTQDTTIVINPTAAPTPTPPPSGAVDAGNDMAYRYNADGFTLWGLYGGAWKSTSYKDYSYKSFLVEGTYGTPTDASAVAYTSGTGLTHETANLTGTIEITPVSGSQLLKLSYTVTNNDDSPVDYAMGTAVDIKIGGDDFAVVTPFTDKVGFKMLEKGVDGAQFNFFGNDVSSFWYGPYDTYSVIYSSASTIFPVSNYASVNGFNWAGYYSGNAEDAIFKSKNAHSFGVAELLAEVPGADEIYLDSTASWRWGGTLAGNSSKTHSVYIGIGAPGQEDAFAIPPATYYVDFEANGATGSVPTQAATVAGGTFILPAATGLTKDGYIFAGWNDGTTTYQAGATYIMPANAVVFTAQWEVAPTYDVTFDANGHGTAPAAITGVTSGSTITAPTAPTADGYTFGGWYTDANCTAAFDFTTPITGNITLYAKWTAVPVTPPADTYTVTLDSTNYRGPYLRLNAYTNAGGPAGEITGNGATILVPKDGYVVVGAAGDFTVAADGATVGDLQTSEELSSRKITNFTKDTTIVINPKITVSEVTLKVDWTKVPELKVGDYAPAFDQADPGEEHYFTITCDGLAGYVYAWAVEDNSSENLSGWRVISGSDTVVTNGEKYALLAEVGLQDGYVLADNVTLKLDDGAVAKITGQDPGGMGIIFELGTLEEIKAAKDNATKPAPQPPVYYPTVDPTPVIPSVDVDIHDDSLSDAAKAVGSAVKSGTADITPVAGYTKESIAQMQKDNALKLVVEKKNSYDPAEKSLIDKAAQEKGKASLVQFLEIDVTLRTMNDVIVAEVDDTVVPLTITVELNAEMQKAAKEGKTIYVARAHDGKVTFIEGTLNAEKTQFTFDSSKFSTYALVAFDSQTVISPKTADAGIFMAVSMSILSVTGSAVLLKKKED